MDKKRILTVLPILMAGAVFSIAVLAQESISPSTFLGTIMKIDAERQEIVVQNKDGAMRFMWNHETWVNGSPDGKHGFVSDNLKAGMLVTVEYNPIDKDRVASRIDVETTNLGIRKGWESPFGCGVTLC